MCALIISTTLSWIRVSLRRKRSSDRNILPIGIFSVPLNRCRLFFFFMCNYKLKISIMWSTIYAVTALLKWGLPCLIQVENFCFFFKFYLFSLTSFGEVFTFFATWKAVRKFIFKLWVSGPPTACGKYLLVVDNQQSGENEPTRLHIWRPSNR